MPLLSRPLLLALLSLNAVAIAPGRAADTPAAPAWGDVLLETLGDGHRVREGHVAPAGTIAGDAREAAAGRVVGATALHDALLRVDRERPHGSPDGDTAYRSGRRGYDGATWIADVGVLLRGDTDGDRFFGAVEFTIDVDTESVERDVYAAIELSEPDGTLTLAHVTQSFTIRGNSANDAYRIEIELLDNHRAADRDVRIEVRDSWSDERLDAVSPWELASLAALPLESEHPLRPIRDDGHHSDGDADYALGVVLTGSGHDTYGQPSGHHSSGIHSSGTYATDTYVAGYAGAAGPLGALALLGTVLHRRRRRDAARRGGGGSL